jgi:hypothetical protein
VSKVEKAKTLTPALASGPTSEARTPTREKSIAPATRRHRQPLSLRTPTVRLGRIAEIQSEQRNPNLSPAGRYPLAIQLHQHQVFLAQLVALRSNVIAAILALKKVCP